MESKQKPIVVIIGPTASGNTATSIQLALKYNGEIIAADSRTVYSGMDIGTAKPSQEEQKTVPHHGLDLVEPSESYSAAEFQRHAKQQVNEIHGRGKLPIIAGGTGLYVDGFVYDFSFADKPDPGLRHELELLNLLQLQQRANELGIDPGQVNFANPRHLSRAIERGGVVQNKRVLPPDVLLVGLRVPKEVLDVRIEKRVGTMFESGLIDEVQNLIKKYGADAPGMLAPGYKAIKAYLNGEVTLDEAKEMFIRNDKKLAKRQITWFKRNPDILWADNEQDINRYVADFLTRFDTI